MIVLLCDFCSKDFPSQDGSIICQECAADLDEENTEPEGDEDVLEDSD